MAWSVASQLLSDIKRVLKYSFQVWTRTLSDIQFVTLRRALGYNVSSKIWRFFVWSNFEKILRKEPIKIKIPTCEEKIKKTKLQMNEHEISIHVNNSWIQVVRLEFTNWKYKVEVQKRPVEVFCKQLFVKILQYSQENVCVGVFRS